MAVQIAFPRWKLFKVVLLTGTKLHWKFQLANWSVSWRNFVRKILPTQTNRQTDRVGQKKPVKNSKTKIATIPIYIRNFNLIFHRKTNEPISSLIISVNYSNFIYLSKILPKNWPHCVTLEHQSALKIFTM